MLNTGITKIPIALIDNSEASVNAFKKYFENSENFDLLFVVPTFEKFKGLYRQKVPIAFLFLDNDLPYQSGVDSLPALKKLLPNTNIVMYTALYSEAEILTAVRRGAAGYVLKDTELDVLEKQILTVADRDGSLLSPCAAKILLNHFQKSLAKQVDAPSPEISFSRKEALVIRLIAEGKTYQQVGTETGMKIDTVRYYIKKIYRKLNVENKVQMLNYLHDKLPE